MSCTFVGVGFFPAIRAAGSPPGMRMKTTKTRKLTASSTATIPSSRRTMKAAMLVLDPDLGARIEGVTEAVAEDVQRQHRHHDRKSRDERLPGCGLDAVLAGRDQVPP